MVDYICYRGKEPWGNVNRGRAESMCRLTHVISSVLIKDRIIVGPSIEIELMPHLDGSKDVRGARREPKGRPGLNVLAGGCP